MLVRFSIASAALMSLGCGAHFESPAKKAYSYPEPAETARAAYEAVLDWNSSSECEKSLSGRISVRWTNESGTEILSPSWLTTDQCWTEQVKSLALPSADDEYFVNVDLTKDESRTQLSFEPVPDSTDAPPKKAAEEMLLSLASCVEMFAPEREEPLEYGFKLLVGDTGYPNLVNSEVRAGNESPYLDNCLRAHVYDIRIASIPAGETKTYWFKAKFD